MRMDSKALGIGLVVLGGALGTLGCGGDDGSGSARPSGSRGGTTGTNTDAGTGGTTGGTTGTSDNTTGGTAGTTTGTGENTSVPPSCPTPEAVTSPLILNFDDGNVQDAAPSLGMYVYAAEGGTITPAQGAEAQGLATPGANGTTSAFRFVGSGFPADAYGGGLGVWMNCRDASSATGLKFWLKSDVPLAVKVEIPANKKATEGGECTGDDTTCQHARFQVEATGGEWKEVEVPFSALTGGKPVSTLDPSQITGIGFEIVKPEAPAAGWGWDVSIDEVTWLGMTVDPSDAPPSDGTDPGNGTAGAPGGDVEGAQDGATP